jgi:hypothetical protein
MLQYGWNPEQMYFVHEDQSMPVFYCGRNLNILPGPSTATYNEPSGP